MYTAEHIILQPLTPELSEPYYRLYTTLYPDADIFLPGETAVAFTQRIVDSCTRIFGLFPKDNPQILIGDCALHHWDRKLGAIEIGGALLPDFQGQGLMREAFSLLCRMAAKEYTCNYIIARTDSSNTAAVKLARSMGFQVDAADESVTVLRKYL